MGRSGDGTHHHPSVHPSVRPHSSEYEDGPHGPTSFARPSAKSIYSEYGAAPHSPPPHTHPPSPHPSPPRGPTDQRKDYGQTLLKPQSNFQHPVEVGDPLGAASLWGTSHPITPHNNTLGPPSIC